MKINIDYKSKVEDINKKDEIFADLTSNYTANAINSKYKEGLDGQKRRIWGRI